MVSHLEKNSAYLNRRYNKIMPCRFASRLEDSFWKKKNSVLHAAFWLLMCRGATPPSQPFM